MLSSIWQRLQAFAFESQLEVKITSPVCAAQVTIHDHADDVHMRVGHSCCVSISRHVEAFILVLTVISKSAK